MKKHKHSFIVTIEYDDEIGAEAVREYVRDSVQSMKGSYHPEDPLFYLKSVAVSHRKDVS